MTKLLPVDDDTARAFEARAQARGQSLAEFLAAVARDLNEWPLELEKMRGEGKGPWSPDVLAEDERRLATFRATRMGIPMEEVEAWAKGLGTGNPLPPPQPRKV
jgi:hypothetical protein